MNSLVRRLSALLSLSVLVAGIASVHADEAEMNRKIDVLSQEIEKLKMGDAPSPDAAESARRTGLGPSASKVYRSARGVSLGGYLELLYQNYDGTSDADVPTTSVDQIDLVRAVLYVGSKLGENFVFNSEFEFEHATTSSTAASATSTTPVGEVSVEFAYLDYLYSPGFNLRAGLLLIPTGLVNELHEPAIFLGARRTETETRILPTTWRENGFGAFGDIGDFTYRSYVTNGLNSSGFTAESLRGGRQKGGSARVGDDWIWTTRIDYAGVNGLLVGGSAVYGESGYYPRTTATNAADVSTRIYELHADWKRNGIEVRALAAMAKLGSVTSLIAAKSAAGSASVVGEELWGGYVQAGYDLLKNSERQSLVPFVRFERLNTQAEVPAGFVSNPANLASVYTYGLNYKPIDSVALKFDYQNYALGDNTGVDQFNVAMGLSF